MSAKKDPKMGVMYAADEKIEMMERALSWSRWNWGVLAR